MLTVAFAEVPTPVGPFMLGVTEDGLATSGWGFDAAARARVLKALDAAEIHDPDRTAFAVRELIDYFAGTLRGFETPVDWRLAGRVQRPVLQALHRVPYGKVVTYGELARKAESSVPARGIGAIMGANPIPIIVPCHRVVAGNGLGGFSGGVGVETKRWLLTHEGYLQPTLLDL